MEEEKVFVNFSAMLSINVVEVKFWQNFNLTVRKLQTQIYSKVVFVLIIVPWEISPLNTLF